MLAAFMVSLLTGPYKNISISDIINYFFKGSQAGKPGIIQYRLIRTTAAMVLGAGLAASGLTMQYALRNPLAEPFLLGVSSGAALGVVLVLVLINNANPLVIYSVAMIFGIITFFVVIGIGARSGGTPTSIIVAGVSVSYAITGIIIILITKYINKINVTFMWLFGTVAYTLRETLLYSIILLIIGLIPLFVMAKRIYTLILGDDVSESMGVDVNTTRYASLILSAIISSAMVALAGPVGFIGLAAPWLARLMAGNEFKQTLVLAILVGILLTLLSDIAVRIASPSQELPLTAFTALFGGPLLFYLSKKTGW
ncbi:MAG: iron ABC transporter permease [Desulfurococcales archaeon]|nr:iron ABC transporter permease [Desulfurococcales archaeon]